MAGAERPSLAEFVRYLPQVRQLGLEEEQLRAIPVHAEPPAHEDFLSLGELPPGAPPIESGRFSFVGTRQIYAYHSDVPPLLWQKLVTSLQAHRPSGTGGTGMFGNPEERVVDEDDPAHSWHVLNAGEPHRPPEL